MNFIYIAGSIREKHNLLLAIAWQWWVEYYNHSSIIVVSLLFIL